MIKMEELYTVLEKKIIHHLILQSPFAQDLGLLYGKMGIALCFFEYGRHTDCKVYTDIGGELLDNIWEQSHSELSPYFDSGLSGIGWSIEYLLQNNFIKGDSNDICEEIDRKVMQINLQYLDDNTLETGLEGFYYYISARMQGVTSQNTSLPFGSDYLKYLSGLNPNFSIKNLDEFYIRYPLSIQSFLKPASVSEASYLSDPIGLKEGVAGFLLKQILTL
jgi:hypothetical protein